MHMQNFHMSSPGVVALVVSLTMIGASGARSPVSTPSAASTGVAPDTVRGIVFDSLTSTPLVDAFITAEGVNATATSDSLGRFTLVSDARITGLTAFHEALDQTGFGALSAQRPAGTDRWTDVVLSTPSLATVWKNVCKLELPTSDNRAVIVGSATLPDNRTRISGASIRVQYEIVLPRTGVSRVEELAAVTDSLGGFAVCGAPIFSEVALIGLSTQVQSGVVRLAFEARPLQRVDLILGPVDGPVSKWPTIGGTIVDEAGKPLAGAKVAVDGRDSAVTTAADGTFSLREVPLGSRMLTVQAEGFSALASPVHVLYENTPSATIPMEKTFAIAGLEGVPIFERTTIRLIRREFEERREAGIAHFVDSSDITVAGSLRAALAQVPALLIEQALGETDSTHFAIQANGRTLGVQTCQAAVFIDGIPARITDVWQVSPTALVAVEVYRSKAFAPPIFAEYVESDCAVVGFWTRFGLRP